MTQISSVHTSCKDCVFAEYENITQTGCAVGYIEIFKQKSVDILEAYDDDKEFFIINDRKCIGYRENKWFEQFGMLESTVEEKITKCNELNYIDYALVIDLKQCNYTDLVSIIDKIDSCSIKPNKVVIIRYPDEKQEFSYIKIEGLLKSKNINCPWRINSIVDLSLSEMMVLDNIASNNINNRFVIYLSNKDADLNNIATKANNIVYKDFDQFVIMGNENKSCFIFSTGVFKYGKTVGKFILREDSEYTVI